MSKNNKLRVCPVEAAGGLDNKFRKFAQNPKKLFNPYIKEGTKVMDFGCGPGALTIGMAKMTGESGKVIAADLQQGMLDIVKKKIKGTSLENKIELHKCEQNKIGFLGKVDFIVAFYVVHEVPEMIKLFEEFKTILNSGGRAFIAEPNFHVSKKAFNEMIVAIERIGFKIIEQPSIFLSRTVVIEN